MQKQALLLSLIPLILFWVVEEFFGLKAALIVGCLAALIELTYEKIKLKKISTLTLFSNGLVLGLGAVSFVMDSGIAFKLQPAVMELVFAGIMIGFRYIKKEPFLLNLFRSMKGIDEEHRKKALAHAEFPKKLEKMDSRMAWFFIGHGLLLVWAAIWGSTRAWILLKGVLFYVLLAAVMLPMYIRSSRPIQPKL